MQLYVTFNVENQKLKCAQVVMMSLQLMRAFMAIGGIRPFSSVKVAKDGCVVFDLSHVGLRYFTGRSHCDDWYARLGISFTSVFDSASWAFRVARLRRLASCSPTHHPTPPLTHTTTLVTNRAPVLIFNI
jgi:hypothetical protein